MSFITSIITKGVYLYFLIMPPPPTDDRAVMVMENETFSLATWLPGDYTSIKTNLDKMTLLNGNCSTSMLNCTYTKHSPTNMSVALSGVMTPALRWATFEGLGSLVPITVVFFNNKTWTSDLEIQPQYSLPLIVPAKDKRTITFTCTGLAFILPTRPKLYAGLEKKEYYRENLFGFVTNTVKDHPQILNLKVRAMAFHKIATVTVRQKDPIDYYSCQVGSVFITHTIDWGLAGASTNLVGESLRGSGFLIGMMCVTLATVT